MKLTTKLGAVAVAGVLAVMAAAPAGAIVPPRDCGFIKVSGKRYNVKADQIRCRTAREYGRTYVRSRRKPSGYKCERGSSRSRILARCVATRYNPDRTFWVIKR